MTDETTTTEDPAVRTWADGFGVWHARVRTGVIAPLLAARRAIRDELLARENDVDRDVWVRLERVPDLDDEGTKVWREGKVATFDTGITAVEAIAEEFGIVVTELRWFASHLLAEDWPSGHGISSSDVSHHLSSLGNYNPEILRVEAERLRDRDALVERIAASTGQTREETLANLQKMFAPKDES